MRRSRFVALLTAAFAAFHVPKQVVKAPPMPIRGRHADLLIIDDPVTYPELNPGARLTAETLERFFVTSQYLLDEHGMEVRSLPRDGRYYPGRLI